MKVNVRFTPYSCEDRDTCLGLFDANCPVFFSPNERTDYLRFLDTAPGGYELCLVDGVVAGAFGLMGHDATRRRLNWIMLNPQFQGLGAGRAIMQRVATLAALEGIHLVDIAASHMSAPFFTRFGAITLTVTNNGWGPRMHRVDMELPLVPDRALERTGE